MGEADLRERYERKIAQVMQMGSRLSTPAAQALPQAQWDELFARYQTELQEVRALGDELRPAPVRAYMQGTDTLVREVLDLFSADT